jgi:hypothetical protein
MALTSFTPRTNILDPFSDFGLGITDPFAGFGGGALGNLGGFGPSWGGGAGYDLTGDDRRRLRERSAIINTDVDWVSNFSGGVSPGQRTWAGGDTSPLVVVFATFSVGLRPSLFSAPSLSPTALPGDCTPDTASSLQDGLNFSSEHALQIGTLLCESEIQNLLEREADYYDLHCAEQPAMTVATFDVTLFASSRLL